MSLLIHFYSIKILLYIFLPIFFFLYFSALYFSALYYLFYIFLLYIFFSIFSFLYFLFYIFLLYIFFSIFSFLYITICFYVPSSEFIKYHQAQSRECLLFLSFIIYIILKPLFSEYMCNISCIVILYIEFFIINLLFQILFFWLTKKIR